MGSDFSVSDNAGRRVSQDNHKLIKEDNKYYYIESIPKDKSDTYAKLELLVAKKIFIPISIVFYDRKGQQLKTLSNNKIKKFKGMYIVTSSCDYLQGIN